jgi:hypothetical protein
MAAKPEKDYVGHQNRLSDEERDARRRLCELLTAATVPVAELLDNLNLFTSHIYLGRTLFVADLYRMIVNTPGVILELGTRWGQNMALLANLRALFEPYNHLRKIVGFDTFKGFPAVHSSDGAAYAKAGNYSVSENYKAVLSQILSLHEKQQPISQICKHELVEGDIVETLPKFLEREPSTVVAMAYFDLDIYEPTLFALRQLAPFLTKGSILAFDELCHPRFPGETVAVREALGVRNVNLRRVAWSTNQAYLIVGE